MESHILMNSISRFPGSFLSLILWKAYIWLISFPDMARQNMCRNFLGLIFFLIFWNSRKFVHTNFQNLFTRESLSLRKFPWCWIRESLSSRNLKISRIFQLAKVYPAKVYTIKVLTVCFGHYLWILTSITYSPRKLGQYFDVSQYSPVMPSQTVSIGLLKSKQWV